MKGINRDVQIFSVLNRKTRSSDSPVGMTGNEVTKETPLAFGLSDRLQRIEEQLDKQAKLISKLINE